MKFLATFIAAVFLGIAYASDEADVVEILPETASKPSPACNTMCLMIYKPVCCLPENQCGECKTYSNACVLGSYNCNNPKNKYYVYTNGTCETIGKATSPEIGQAQAVSEIK